MNKPKAGSQVKINWDIGTYEWAPEFNTGKVLRVYSNGFYQRKEPCCAVKFNVPNYKISCGITKDKIICNILMVRLVDIKLV